MQEPLDRRAVATHAGIQQPQLERTDVRAVAGRPAFRDLSRSAHNVAGMPDLAIALLTAVERTLGVLAGRLRVGVVVGVVLLVAVTVQFVLALGTGRTPR